MVRHCLQLAHLEQEARDESDGPFNIARTANNVIRAIFERFVVGAMSRADDVFVCGSSLDKFGLFAITYTCSPLMPAACSSMRCRLALCMCMTRQCRSWKCVPPELQMSA